MNLEIVGGARNYLKKRGEVRWMVDVSTRISTNVRAIAAPAKVIDAERVKEGNSYTVHNKRLGGKTNDCFLFVSCFLWSFFCFVDAELVQPNLRIRISKGGWSGRFIRIRRVGNFDRANATGGKIQILIWSLTFGQAKMQTPEGKTNVFEHSWLLRDLDNT